MGMTTFLKRLHTDFLNQLGEGDAARHVDVADGDAVVQWVSVRFGQWFLDHRDDLLAREWARQGWAEVVYRRGPTGHFKEVYVVKPHCAETVNAWLQDELA
jgi:hypothetical protein